MAATNREGSQRGPRDGASRGRRGPLVYFFSFFLFFPPPPHRSAEAGPITQTEQQQQQQQQHKCVYTRISRVFFFSARYY